MVERVPEDTHQLLRQTKHMQGLLEAAPEGAGAAPWVRDRTAMSRQAKSQREWDRASADGRSLSS